MTRLADLTREEQRRSAAEWVTALETETGKTVSAVQVTRTTIRIEFQNGKHGPVTLK